MRGSLIASLLLGALLLAGCSDSDHVTGAADPQPSVLEPLGEKGFYRITLSDRAMERIDLLTAEVESQMVDGEERLIVPHGAVVYDPEGLEWTYASPEPGVFLRERLDVDFVADGSAILESGPAVGTLVVYVGAAELYGLEFGIGK